MRLFIFFALLLLAFDSFPAMACAVPPPRRDDAVVFLNAYAGARYPSHSIAGRDEATTVVRVSIGKGNDDLYIVAVAATPVIWQVEGDTARVSSFVAVGPALRGGAIVKAGVAGLDGTKVSFALLRDCIPVVSQDGGSAETAQAMASVAAMTGRAAALSAHAPKPMDFTVSDTAATALLVNDSGGVVDFKPEYIVADADVKAYDVLPQGAGLAQLMAENRIVKVGGAYKIVKDIQRYPAGLTGAHAVRFILGKGIHPPAGDPGHSCVITEETEQPLNARMANNCR